jgi:hypothetical protein
MLALAIKCTDDGASDRTTIMSNKSGENIQIQYFRNGILSAPGGAILSETGENYINLTIDENKMVNQAGGFGKLKGALIISADSALVIFDQMDSVYHYNVNINGSNPKAIFHNSQRNIFNPEAYNERIIRETDDSFIGEYIYTFTLQDYLDAQ